MNSNSLLTVILTWLGIAVFPAVASADQIPSDGRLELPSPMEIRNYEPQPNSLMTITYANGRVYLFHIEEVNPRSDCNQIQYNIETKKIKIITQAVSNAYEYVLLPVPSYVSEWVMLDTPSPKVGK
jgi:hypothetical protein